jgi:lipoyl(octanoyl) transferase
MLNLKARQAVPDIKKYVWQLEEWVMRSLAAFDIVGERRAGRVGIWVNMERYGGAMGEEAKIAAIGVRVRHWITLHGVSVNVAPNLSHFGGIVPCGIAEHGVTSIEKLIGQRVETDEVMQSRFKTVFGE